MSSFDKPRLSRTMSLSQITGKPTTLLSTPRSTSRRGAVGDVPPPVYQNFRDEMASQDYWARSHRDYDGPPRTKIIATIGPNTKTPEMLEKLMEAGMNVVRLNFSHGDHAYFREVVGNARAVAQKSRRLCAIMLDTKGPEIRTGLLKDGKDVQLLTGQSFTFNVDPTFVEGDNTMVHIQYANFANVVKVNDKVLLDDGLISCRVVRVDQAKGLVHTTVENDGMLGQRKGVNLPGVVVDLPAVTEKDRRDLEFGAQIGVDLVAASFVRKAGDVHEVRRALGPQGEHIKIISKIESQEGIDNFAEILHASDGIMVARGDLGVEIPVERVALAQKRMIAACNRVGKPVITATQMLESMCVNPSPTRAEAVDVANAVFDGTDCVMLSGETAKGKYPVESVRMMRDICREAESSIDYESTFSHIHGSQERQFGVSEAVASSAVRTLHDVRGGVLLCMTSSGRTARQLAMYRPAAPILTLTDNARVSRQCLVSRGVVPLLVSSLTGTDSLIDRACEVAKKMGLVKPGDAVVVASGTIENQSGATNMLKVLKVKY
ncbi:MAG: hypothetical protein MHM6MM_000039 [Cercozoa sp. M6MM]